VLEKVNSQREESPEKYFFSTFMAKETYIYMNYFYNIKEIE